MVPTEKNWTKYICGETKLLALLASNGKTLLFGTTELRSVVSKVYTAYSLFKDINELCLLTVWDEPGQHIIDTTPYQ